MHLRSGEGGKRIRWIGGALKQGGLVILFHLLRLSLAGDWHVGTEYLRYLLGGGGGLKVITLAHLNTRLCLIFWPLFLRWFSAEVWFGLFCFFARIIQTLNPPVQVEMAE